LEIDISIIRVSDDKIQYKLSVSRPLKKYFLTFESYIEYLGADLKSVNDSLLIIPMLCTIAPIAWATGANIHVAEIDASFLTSLKKVKEVYRKFKSNFSFAGDIYSRKIVSNSFNGSRTGLLFSGGVDSLTSYLRHKDLKPDFISIWGLPDLPQFEKMFWQRTFTDISCLASLDSLSVFQVKTDILRSINFELLGIEFRIKWFVEAAFGPFMLGFTAPLSVLRGLGTIMIASSYTEDYRGFSASHPLIDENISWADVRVEHDGFELSRQQKLKYLVRAENRRYLEHLRVCWDNALKTNCGDCEKCMRTITGLAVEGIDPNTCNFKVDSKTFPLIKECFLQGMISFNQSQLYMWKDIQNNIGANVKEDIYGSKEFLTWLKEYDLPQYKADKIRTLLRDIHRLYRYKRNFLPSFTRKLKCYYLIALARFRIV
jgi:hypothetical protein